MDISMQIKHKLIREEGQHSLGGADMAKIVVIADFALVPVGTSRTSMGEEIAIAIKAIEDQGIRYEVTPMGTVMEAESLEDILKAVGKAHEEVMAKGVKRVISNLRIDDRRDKPRTKEDKVKRIEEEFEKVRR
jgi:uncharacterized protein (TIGR00106 family)